jgi:UDP-GlcNAc:undecaprenyl-phosphate GlcNAc-1-phosphate transferase
LAWLELFFLFAISYIVVLLTVPVVRKYALQLKLGDKPNGRKIHASVIPHLGGIGITCGILCALALYEFLFRDTIFLFGRMIPGVSLIIILGLLDDLINLRALQKLTIQILAGIILVISGFELVIGIAAIDTVPFLTMLMTIFYLVAVSNSINLVDGHDGLAAGLCFISSLSLIAVAMILQVPDAMLLSLATGGACLAFLAFNFPPAKIFMGDTGSMLLGMCLGLAVCSLTIVKPSFYTLIATCFMLGVPILDTVLAIARRLTLRAPVFGADCLHMHHIVSSFGMSERQTLLILYCIHTVFCIIGVFAMQGFLFSVVLGSSILVILFSLFLRWMIAATRAEKEVDQKIVTKLTHDSFPSLDKIAK